MKVRASSAVILKTLLKMICMSADDGSRSTIVMGLPSGQIRVCALKIFTSSALVRLVVEFAVSATIASCFAWAVPDAAATHTNARSRRQSFIRCIFSHLKSPQQITEVMKPRLRLVHALPMETGLSVLLVGTRLN